MKQEENSSLELLLDTMCNTFGGVMFIAISLVVIISMTNASRQPSRENDRSAEELLARIQSLKTQLDTASQQQKQLAEQTADLNDDPRLKELSELALLETTAKQLKLQVALENQSLVAATQKQTAVQKTLDDSRALVLSLADDIKNAEKQSAELSAALAALRQEKAVSSLRMVFTTLESKEEMPYYIILQGDQAWRIGPEAPDNLLNPHADVSFSVVSTNNGSNVTCTPRPDAHTPVFSKESISPQLNQILAAIPKDRIPCFAVNKTSAAAFYKLRELLKHSRRIHGFVLNTSDSSFTYSTSDEDVKYEY